MIMRCFAERYSQKTHFIIGLLLFSIFYYIALHQLVLAWISLKNVVPGGVLGDQAFYLWILERARTSISYGEFIHNCALNSQGYILLTVFPQEWPNLYFIGKLGAFLHLTVYDTMNFWYLGGLLLNGVAAAFFLSQFTRSPVFYLGLAPLVAFQQSLICRLMGHFSLIAGWPMFFFLAFLIKALKSVISTSRPSYTTILGLALTGFYLTQASFYYFIFSFVTVAFATSVFAAINIKKIDLKTAKRFFKSVLPCAMALALGLWIIRFTFLPEDGRIDKRTFIRNTTEVQLYSARWTDFIFPPSSNPAYTVLKTIGLGGKFEWFKNRDEIFGFLGLAVLFALATAVITLIFMLLLKRFRAGLDSFPWRDSIFLGVMLLIVLFFSTVSGGLAIHAVFQSLRCFSRFAPLAALFACAFSALTLPHLLKNHVLRVLFFIPLVAAGVYEISHEWHFKAARMVSTNECTTTIAGLREICASHTIILDPAVPDYPRGPYPIYFWAQAAGCQISNISGPGLLPGNPSFNHSLPRAVVYWKENPDIYHPKIIEIAVGSDGKQ